MSEITDFMNLPDHVPAPDPRDATLSRLTSALEAAREALEPFAAIGDCINRGLATTSLHGLVFGASSLNDTKTSEVGKYDWLRAHTALTTITAALKGELQ